MKSECSSKINRLTKPAVISGIPTPGHKVGDTFKYSWKEYCEQYNERFVITKVIRIENGAVFMIEYIYEAKLVDSDLHTSVYYFSEAVVSNGKE